MLLLTMKCLLLWFLSCAYSLDNMGKVYPPPVGYLKPRPPTLRCLTFRPRPLQEPRKKYFVDIDGTICNTYKNDYFISTPKRSVIEYFNRLYDEGHEIHYWTSRGTNTGKIWDKVTLQQLRTWKCKYDTINIGKPHYDYWVDDKAIHVNDLPISK